MDERYAYMRERKPALREFYQNLERHDWQQLEPLLRLGRAIADPVRLRILGFLVKSSLSEEELKTILQPKTPSEIERHLSILEVANLVKSQGGVYELDRLGLEHLISLLKFEELERVSDTLNIKQPLAAPLEIDQQAMVIAAYFDGARLVAIPSEREARYFVLKHISKCFVSGRTYAEVEVNGMLKAFNEDVASLRRGLVDEGFVMRNHGEYRRD